MFNTADQQPAEALTRLDDPTAQRSAAPKTSLPHSAQTHYVTLDRSRLERALAALEAPDGVEAGPMRLACAHDAIVLSRAWGGMRLSATVGLNTARNNLPRRGLVLEASEPFGSLGGNGRLTLGYPHAGSRRVDLTVTPGAGHVIVAVGNATLAVPAAFVGPDTPTVGPSGLRLRRVSAQFAPAPTDGTSDTPPSSFISLIGSATLVSAEATNLADATVTTLPLPELARLLTRLGDLTDRLPRADDRDRRDTSEVLCRFDDRQAPSATPQETGYVSYLVFNDNPFAYIAKYSKAPMTDFEVEIMPHGFAPELCCIRPEASMEPSVFPALRTRTGRRSHFVEIRVPRATAQWACDEMGPEDRLMMGVSADGRVDVLLARVSDDPAFIVAPTMADPVDPTPESVMPGAEPANAT